MDAPQKILIVDDRPENLMVLEMSLADTGVEIVKAAGGEQALKATLNMDFALAILDVQMPGMDGFELAELLRGDPKTRHMPIIFLSAAYSEETHIFKGYESGAVEYIVKPYNKVILNSKVRVLLEMDSYRRELQEHRDRLDELVEQRTRELEMVNQELRAEIEERRKTEAMLNEAVAALQCSNRELEQFAYVASHDLQEPLRMVASFTQMLAQRYDDQLDEKGRSYIAYAVEGARRMQGLINDLLSLSRVVTRARVAESIDCNEVVANVLKDLSRLISESGANVVVEWLPRVLVDQSQLSQVFQNLIANAIKFSGDAIPRVVLSAARKDSFYEICIEDNGIGIAPEFHERIFVIFQRLHPRAAYPGNGIGLSIVKKIVERHGGQVRVESALGQGSRFYFTIPAAIEPED